MIFSHDFRADLATLLHEAEHGEPFAFVRFNDGERAILEDKQVQTADGWKVGNPEMRRMMADALNFKSPRYFKGITCSCCDAEGASYYQRILAEDGRRITFANLFVNGNADVAIEAIRRLAWNWCVVACYWGSDIRVPSNWCSIRNLENYVSSTAVRMMGTNQPILVAAGPLAKVLIDRYWAYTNDYRRHTILDIGSVLDPLLHGYATRNYHNPEHPNRQKICLWTVDTP